MCAVHRWDGDQQWYDGIVTDYDMNSKKHTVEYSDGETKTHLLTEGAGETFSIH